MTIRKWETKGQSSIFESPFGSLRSVERIREGDTESAKFLLFDFPDWVNIVATTSDGDVVLIRQFRQGTAAITLEIPGGIVDPDEDFLDAAKRELEEETGYRSDDWVSLGVVEPNPAIQSNRCATFWAKDAELSGDVNWDEHEEIEVVLIPRVEIAERVRSGEITHSLVVAAFYHLESMP